MTLKTARIAVLVALAPVCAQTPGALLQDGTQREPIAAQRTAAESVDPARTAYVLGPGDQVVIRAVDVEEINDKPVDIDAGGFLRLPMAGSVQASGMNVRELEAELTQRLRKYVLHPDVSVSVVKFRSQPVSIVGAVKAPGVYQVEGRKTLIEVLSMAGGLDPAAGSTLNITRRIEAGRIPLSTAKDDATHLFSVANLDLKSILDAKNPEENILVKPHDVITVPRAELIYVVGEVQRAGGFPLHDHETMSVLQALSLAGGLDRTAAPSRAKILRAAAGAQARIEVPVNLQQMLDGKIPDYQMQPEDILFLPSSTPKKAAGRALEAAIQMGTGIAIWRR